MNDGENPDSGQELGPFGKQAKAAITPDKPDVGQNIGTSGAGGNDKAKAAGSLLNNLEKKATGGGGAGTDSESDIPFKGGGAGAAKQGADLVNAIAKKDPKALLNLAKSGKNGGMMKYAPTAAIGAILIVIVVIVGFVMLALQPIHMVEQIFDKYASGSWTSNLRYNEMLTKKYFGGGQKGATSATNSSNLNTDTVFTTVSQQTIDASKAAGFTLATTPSSTVDGQFVVTSITDDTTGKTMTESDFTDAMNNDASFRDRIYQVYNPRVAIWYDRTAEDFKNRFNLTENNAGLKMPDSSSDSTTDSTATSWVQKLLAAIMPSAKAADDTSTDNPTGEAIAQQSNDGTYQSNQTEQSCAKEDKDKNLIASDCSSSGAKQVGGIISDQVEDAKSKLTDEVNQELLKSIAVSAIGALGPLDAYCTTMSTLDLINTATKEIRAGQLMKYAQIFMATADKIKAGDATADEVSAVMTQINGDAYQQVLDSDGQPTGKTTGPKTGTESAGWQWLVDGTIDSNDPSLAKYHIGTANGKLFDLAQSIASMPEKMANSGKLGEAVKTVCGLMGNPFVRIANVVGGIFTIATIPFKNGPAVAGLMYFMHVAAPMLIQVLAAKTITTDIAGEDSMNALVSGAGMMHARNCEANGCTNLTKSTAGKAYLEYQKYIAQVGDDERYSHSPFDPTTKYTFLGNIMSSILDHASSLQSVSGVLTSVGSMATTAIASISPTTHAYDLASYTNYLTTDPDTGGAVDPLGVPVMGATNLNLDPDTVVQDLKDKGDLDSSSNIVEGSDLAKFQQYCATRKDPYGVSFASDYAKASASDKAWMNGTNCVDSGVATAATSGAGASSSDTNLYAIYTMDSRIESNMDGDGLSDPGMATGGIGSTTSSSSSSSSNNTSPSLGDPKAMQLASDILNLYAAHNIDMSTEIWKELQEMKQYGGTSGVLLPVKSDVLNFIKTVATTAQSRGEKLTILGLATSYKGLMCLANENKLVNIGDSAEIAISTTTGTGTQWIDSSTTLSWIDDIAAQNGMVNKCTLGSTSGWHYQTGSK